MAKAKKTEGASSSRSIPAAAAPMGGNPGASTSGVRVGGAAVQAGDRIRVSCGDGDEYIGILLPRTQGADEFITLKLSSGYNIGIKRARIKGTQVLEAAASQLLGSEKPAKAPQTSKQFVSLLGCGGTIVNRIDYRTGAVHPATTPEELMAGLPKIAGMPVRAKNLFSIASEDITAKHWQKLADEIAAQLKAGAEGVVIAHGTDAMHYTSAALSFMLQNLPSPVILTGSQRSSDRGSSDADQNARSALLAAKADFSGVFICMHENMSDEACLLHFGTKVRKMHTSRRDAFRSINVQPAARIYPAAEKIEKLSPLCPSRNPPARLLLETALNTNVAMQYVYPGIKPSQISALSKFDGVVLVGTGLGHIPANTEEDKLAAPILKEAAALVQSGVPVFLASQCIYGRADMNVYTNGRALVDAGIMGSLCDMTPETAYVKLMWVLGREKKMEKVKALMETSIAGEISGKTEITGY